MWELMIDYAEGFFTAAAQFKEEFRVIIITSVAIVFNVSLLGGIIGNIIISIKEDIEKRRKQAMCSLYYKYGSITYKVGQFKNRRRAEAHWILIRPLLEDQLGTGLEPIYVEG